MKRQILSIIRQGGMPPCYAALAMAFLLAVASPAGAASVTYNFSDTTGTVTTDNNTYNEGDVVTVLDYFGQTYTYGGNTYDFAGWFDGSTLYNEDDTFTMPADDVTLYAVWVQEATYGDLLSSVDIHGIDGGAFTWDDTAQQDLSTQAVGDVPLSKFDATYTPSGGGSSAPVKLPVTVDPITLIITGVNGVDKYYDASTSGSAKIITFAKANDVTSQIVLRENTSFDVYTQTVTYPAPTPGTYNNIIVYVHLENNYASYYCNYCFDSMNNSDNITYDTNSATITTTGTIFLLPLITTQPSDTTVTAGQTATFSVAATGGMEPLAYQWQVNSNNSWRAIKDATNTSYTTATTTPAMSGYQYRCVATDAGGMSVTSDAATLTVNEITLTLSATGGTYDDNAVTLTAVVGAGLKPVPTGSVTFMEGETTFAAVPLDNSGAATYVVPSLIAQGIHTYTAEYSGDDNYLANSAPATINVMPYLSVSPNALNFIAAGETKSFSVMCNTYWTLGNSASWLTISSGDDDNTMAIKAAANPDAVQRYALLNIGIAGVTSQSIAVTQDAADKTAIETATAPSVVVYSQNGDVIVRSDVPVQSVAVYDVSGKMLKQAKVGSNLITISGLPKNQVLIVKVETQVGIRNYETTFDVVN